MTNVMNQQLNKYYFLIVLFSALACPNLFASNVGSYIINSSFETQKVYQDSFELKEGDSRITFQGHYYYDPETKTNKLFF